MFVRMSILLVINMVAVRYVRSGLGIESYGLLNAITGFVHLLSCLGVVLSAASLRFLSMAMGENNIHKMREVFTTSLRISLYFSLLVIVLFETIGLWFVITRMNYPVSELHTVIWIYQFSIIHLINTLIQVPYLATITAHEEIRIFAGVTLLEAIHKLVAALAIPLFTSYSLIVYTGLLLVFSLLSTVIYIWFSYKNFGECQSLAHTNQHIRPMLSFSTWTLLGSLAGSALIQGNTILINIYSGNISNAAFAVAISIYSAILQVGNSIFVAIRSRMIQSYSNHQYNYLNQLFVFSQKALIWILIPFSILLFYWMPDILKIWLGDIDEETISCSRGMMLSACILIFNNPITIIIQATGHVKQYHLLIEFIILLSIPCNWYLLVNGFSPAATCYVILFFCSIAHLARFERLKRFYPSISYSAMFKQLFIPIGCNRTERELIKSIFPKK